MIKLGYVIAYVPRVEDALSFFERAFGLERRFVHESGDYGELDTGATVLAFASEQLGDANFPAGYLPPSRSEHPVGIEVALVTDSVASFHSAALEHGAVELQAPVTKPWGQTVAYVQSPDGIVVEICSPVGA